MPNEDQQQKINWEKDENFEFAFDIALSPNIKLNLGQENQLNYYKIRVTDEMIDKQVEMVVSQLGQNIPAESVGEKSLVRGNFIQLDGEGNELNDGIKTDGVLLSVDLMKDTEIKNAFIQRKKDEVLVFDPVKAYNDRHEVGHLLNVKHEVAEILNSDFRFTITEILDFKKAELNEDLFKKIYGEDAQVTTVEDFRNRIKDEISTSLSYSSEHRFTIDTRDVLVEQTNMLLPEAFLKKWLIAINKQLTLEQVEADFGNFITDLKWQLIKNKIIDENNLEVSDEESVGFAKKLAQSQFQQYGYYEVPDEQLENFAHKILEKPEENERIFKKLFEDKIIAIIKEKVQILEKEVTQEEFNELYK